MKNLALAGALLCALVISACSKAQLEKIDAAVVKVDQVTGSIGQQIQKYCAPVQIGLPVVASMSGTKAQQAYTQAEAAAVGICSQPITDSASALAAVKAAYQSLRAVGVDVQVKA